LREISAPTDLTHFSEGRAVFTVNGAANTAEQWGQHALEELANGDSRAVGKQLSRFERDLVKSRELAGMATNTSLRRELQELQALLKQAPGRARELAGRIRDLVARGQSEAGMLKVYGKSGPLRQGIVRILMDAVSALGASLSIMPQGCEPDGGLSVLCSLLEVQAAYHLLAGSGCNSCLEIWTQLAACHSSDWQL
jgi:hypothetical protein